MKEQAESKSETREWKLAELAPVLEALKGLRFGSVEIVVQDSRIVQIERKEKFRPSRS